MPGADELRRELRELEDRRARGDVSERDFTSRRDKAQLALSRALVADRLEASEAIVAEHHVVHSHFKVTGSILREPVQATVSLFATDRRLIRVSGRLVPGQAVTGDDSDGTKIDELPYRAVRALAWRRQRRWGEVAVGLTAAALAFALGRILAVTGPLLMALGVAGALHGLFLPTRWVELVTEDGAGSFVVPGLRRKSARQVLAAVRRSMADREGRVPAAGNAGVVR